VRAWALVALAGCRIGFDPVDRIAGDALDGDGISGDAPAAICGTRTAPSLAMGAGITCMVRLDGSLWCAGTGYGTLFEQIGTSRSWLRVDGEETAFCALDVDCSLWCFGVNTNGQLGLGDKVNRAAPTLVTPGVRYRDVGAGGFHICAIREDRTLWCAGRNDVGQLGLGITGSEQADPQQVGSATWRSIARGYLFNCALDTSDRVWCWGGNDEGQLGQGDFGAGTERSSPVLVGAVGHANDWALAGAGKQHACTRGKEGTLWCWGLNAMGQVGRGDLMQQQTTPFQTIGTTWDRIALGRFTTCATAADRSLSCWGDNAVGAVGVPGMATWTTPQLVPAPAQWSTVSPMNLGTCAFDAAGDLYCWGDNTFGQLGVGDTNDRAMPTRVTLP
jgi:alpha-tubulin suppressor-like RCC1 family protein